jgi:DNA-binding XRE family transcriptional regulator
MKKDEDLTVIEDEERIDTGYMIRSAREERGLTRTDLYDLTGIKPSTIAKHENEGVVPSALMWLAYSKAFGWPMPELVSGGSNTCLPHSLLDLQKDLLVLGSA